MSQDTGLWSVRRARETLGGLNLNSGIPQPPSAMKRSSTIGFGGSAHGGAGAGSHVRSMSGSRQSLAMGRPNQPMFQRSSSGANLADAGLSSVKRASVSAHNLNNTTSLRTPGPAAHADRRSSVYQGSGMPRPSMAPGMAMGSGMGAMGGGMGGMSGISGGGHHQSFFQQAPQAAGVPRDPRPLKDRAYQNRLGQELIEYLAQNNFEMTMSHKLSDNFIKSPTQKDFNYMFQWLYHRIDPSYRFQKNIDQEVPPLLKLLRYPYERSITKSQIAAVGGQNWSTFLGLLHWMMQLAQMLERYGHGQYDDATLEAGVDVSGDKIAFAFLASAYKDWLNMDDEAGDDDVERALAPHIQFMAREFEQSNAKYTAELEILEGENARLLKEIEDLEKSTPDPTMLDNHFKIMEEDKAKFEEYNTLAMQRSEKYESRIAILQEELDKLHGELQVAEDERRALQRAVDDQGISMQDIDRMTSERERLQKSIESAAARLEETKTRVAAREAEAAARLDELEHAVHRYNALAYQIGLIPSSAVNAKGQDYELVISLSDPSSSDPSSSSRLLAGGGGSDSQQTAAGHAPSHILNLDLRGQVKSSLFALRKEISERRKVAMDLMMEDHDLLESTKEAIEDKRNEVEALEHRVRAAEEEYEREKENTTTQKMTSDAQIEKMEKDLAKMRASLSESVQLMEQREMNVNIEYEQLVLRANALREELHTETMRMLNDVIKFKMHVQRGLEEYESFVADELERELGSGSFGGGGSDDNTITRLGGGGGGGSAYQQQQQQGDDTQMMDV